MKTPRHPTEATLKTTLNKTPPPIPINKAMNVVVPLPYIECARVYVNQANSARFVIKCNYCNDESSDWLEYVGHLHGDHISVEKSVESLAVNEPEVGEARIYKKYDSAGDVVFKSTASLQDDLDLEQRDENNNDEGMIEEYLDYECLLAETNSNNGNCAEDYQAGVASEFNLNNTTENCPDVNIIFSSLTPNGRTFRLRSTPFNIMMTFIDILRENPLQWDHNHPDYSNKEKRHKSSLQFSQHIRSRLNININPRAASRSALALIRWFHREHKRFTACEKRNLKFVCYRREYFEKLLKFLPLPTLSCDRCEKRFQSEHLLMSHNYKYHKGHVPFACRFCDRVFIHPSSLKLHENRHIKVDLWPCTKCLYQSSSKADYLKHLAIHSPKQSYKCDKCGLTYKTATNLSVHKKTHMMPEYECDVCQKQFYSKYRYKRHVWDHHDVFPVMDGKESVNTFMDCSLCGRRFTSQQTLLKHQVVHMLENYNLNKDEDEVDSAQNVRKELHLNFCDYCSLEFINNEAYGVHMMLKHAIDIK